MAEVMLEDTRIHYLDAGPPDADLILLLLHALPLQAAMWDGSSAGSATAPGDRPGPEGVRRPGCARGPGRLLGGVLRRRRGRSALVLAGVTSDAATPEEAAANGEQQHWIRVQGDLRLLINRLVDQLVGRETSRRAEAVKLARQLMGANPPAGWIGGLGALTNRPDFGPDLVADAGHLVTLEQPEAVSRAVERLLERI